VYEFCLLLVFDGDEVVYIVCVFIKWIMMVVISVGMCFLVYVILMGWVLLVV